MSDKKQDLYLKYFVSRTDGRDKHGEKHECCDYFVLDVTHDPHAIPALYAYAKSCREEGFKRLATTLERKAADADHRLNSPENSDE